MARLVAILKTLAVIGWRDTRSLRSITTNNFLLFSVLLLQHAGLFVYLLLALVMLFPLCADPLRKVPRERLSSWPLTAGQRRLLRSVSPWMNPMTWVLAAVAIWAAQSVVSVGLFAAFAGVFALAFFVPILPGAGQDTIWRAVPRLPTPLAELVLRNLRGLVSTLDFYGAALLSLSALLYRATGQHLPSEGLVALVLLVVLALSSYAQCLFGLDGAGGITRLRLLPIRGWQILAAKGAAFLVVIVVLTLPLAPLSGLSAGLVALSVGHATSVRRRWPQIRWRFSTGTVGSGFVQVAAMSLAGVATMRVGASVLILFMLVYAVSVWWFGREMERVPAR